MIRKCDVCGKRIPPDDGNCGLRFDFSAGRYSSHVRHYCKDCAQVMEWLFDEILYQIVEAEGKTAEEMKKEEQR